MLNVNITDLLHYPRMQADFSELLGKTIIHIHKTEDTLLFFCADGTKYIQFHYQECCESVTLEDICGELGDLLASPILQAEEEGQEFSVGAHENSSTWTFYKLATIKGSVTLRWYGTSNGYYSENVDFAQIITKDIHNV